MAYSLYDAVVVNARAALTSLDTILREAEQHPKSAEFFDARLIEDMRPLTFQVYYACDQAFAIAAKVSGKEQNKLADDLDTYEKMYARIQSAIEALDETSKETVNKLGETTTSVSRRDEVIEVPVKALTASLNMPNMYFHVCMAYAILRKEGVELGKGRWTRAFVKDYV